MTEGRIVKALSGFYYVQTAEALLQCRARGKFRKDGLSPLVGDRVVVRTLEDSSGMVWEIAPRRNAFVRPAVANIDQLVIIASEAVPETSPFLIDRMAADPAFGMTREELSAHLDPAAYTGRCPEQGEEFLAEYIQPVLERYAPALAGADAELKV